MTRPLRLSIRTKVPPRELKAGDQPLLSWVPDDEVPKALRGLARQHARRLARRHGLGEVPVRFYGPARHRAGRPPLQTADDRRFVMWGDFFGTARADNEEPASLAPDDETGGIALHEGVTGEVAAIAFLVAHEIRHVIGKRDGARATDDECDVFASQYIAGLGLL